MVPASQVFRQSSLQTLPALPPQTPHLLPPPRLLPQMKITICSITFFGAFEQLSVSEPTLSA